MCIESEEYLRELSEFEDSILEGYSSSGIFLKTTSFTTFLLYCSVCYIYANICRFLLCLAMMIPSKKKDPIKVPLMNAFFAPILGPALIPKTPQVKIHENIWLKASSVFLKYNKVHYVME